MKKIGIVRHSLQTVPDLFIAHENNSGHPESPARLKAIDQALGAATDLKPSLVELYPRPATRQEVESVHTPAYLDWLDKMSSQAVVANSRLQLDADTHLNPFSRSAAYLAAGAGLRAVEAFRENPELAATFALVRPPGHHALANQPMGFCLLNNIAVAARYCLDHLGYKRVMILDWDVHHGNGTQEAFWRDPRVLFVSIQRWPQWPYSGWFTDVGAGDGTGYTLNIPMPAGTSDTGYDTACYKIVEPVAHEYCPELILLSAGYDAHEADPLGGMKVTTNGFNWLSQRLAVLCWVMKVRVAVFLEGGYQPQALADSVVTTIRALATTAEKPHKVTHGVRYRDGPQQPLSQDADPAAVEDHIRSACRYLSCWWRTLR